MKSNRTFILSLFREIRELSGASVLIQGTRDRDCSWRLISIKGSERNVEFAKHLIKIRLKLHEKALDKGE